jgi:hypothetical protein
MAERLGRHAMLFQARCRRSIRELTEPVVHDHFETFIGRQDRALGIGTAVGSQSWFVYDIDPAPHRGSGRRPDRKLDPDKPVRSSRSYVRSIERTLCGLIPLVPTGRPLIFQVDGRNDYRIAAKAQDTRSSVVLDVYPNPTRGPKGTPRSPDAKRRDSAMFPVDQLHQLLRHSMADQKRETIAFGRRLESIVGRAYLLSVWKNFIKRRTERKPDRSTPAMRLGLAESLWRWERVFTRRLFVTREALPFAIEAIYRKRWSLRLPEPTRKHAE